MRTRFFLILSIFATVVFGIVSISAAQNPAQDYGGGYIGFSGGVSHYSSDVNSFISENGTSLSMSMDGISAEGLNFGVFGGYGQTISSSKYFGLEGNIGFNTADFKDSATITDGVDEVRAEDTLEANETYGFNVRLGQMVGDWMVYGLAGWQWTNMEQKSNLYDSASGQVASATGDEDFDGPRFGLGAEYQTQGQAFFRGEYTYTMYDEIGAFEPTEGSFKLGFGLRF